jgi:hypothetical protein
MELLSGEPNISGPAAQEGTAAHEVGEICLKSDGDKKPLDFIGDFIDVDVGKPNENRVLVDAEMASNVEGYINYVERQKGASSECHIELKVDYSEFAPEGFGKADCVLVGFKSPPPELHDDLDPDQSYYCIDVIDYKNGMQRVSARGNTQTRLYGIGALLTLDPMLLDEPMFVGLHIYQPKIDNVSVEYMLTSDLLEWARTTCLPAAQLAHKLLSNTRNKIKNNPDKLPSNHLEAKYFKPSKSACKWCLAAPKCKHRLKQGYEAAVDGFTDLTEEAKSQPQQAREVLKISEKDPLPLKVPQLIHPEDLASIYKDTKAFVKFLKDLEARIRTDLEAGKEIPGLTLVAGKKTRGWVTGSDGAVDSDKVIRSLRTAGFVKKDYEKVSLITPPQAEEMLKKLKPKDHKKRFEKLTSAVIVESTGKQQVSTAESPKNKVHTEKEIKAGFDAEKTGANDLLDF